MHPDSKLSAHDPKPGLFPLDRLKMTIMRNDILLYEILFAATAAIVWELVSSTVAALLKLGELIARV